MSQSPKKNVNSELNKLDSQLKIPSFSPKELNYFDDLIQRYLWGSVISDFMQNNKKKKFLKMKYAFNYNIFIIDDDEVDLIASDGSIDNENKYINDEWML